MTASLQEKNSKYYIVVNCSDEDGNRSQKWYPTGLDVSKTSRKKAEQYMRNKVLELETAPKKPSRKPRDPKPRGEIGDDRGSFILFSNYVRYWLDLIEKRKRVDTVTIQGYRLTAQKHVLPYFDDLRIKLVDVDKKTLQRFFDTKADTMRSDGRGKLSANSVKHIKNVVSLALKEAVKEDLIPANPCSCVEIPKIEPHQANYYNAQQIRALFDAMQGDILEPLIKITMLYGLRRSEVLGIKWDSIDFAQRRLTILHTVSKVTKTVEKDKTKTKSSRRTLPLVPFVKERLLSLQKEQKENRRLCGRCYNREFEDYICVNEIGDLIKPEYVSSTFGAFLDEHGLRRIRFHDLRHSCASLMLSSGVPMKQIQEWLGHSDFSTTANIYAHLEYSSKISSADAMLSGLGITAS